MLNRLNTRDRLGRFMNLSDMQCVLCRTNDMETKDHLFFKCNYSAECLKLVKNWVGWECLTTEMNHLVRWIQRWRETKCRKQIIVVCLAALIYRIWQERNRRVWRSEQQSAEKTFESIRADVKNRILFVNSNRKKGRDREGYMSL